MIRCGVVSSKVQPGPYRVVTVKCCPKPGREDRSSKQGLSKVLRSPNQSIHIYKKDVADLLSCVQISLPLRKTQASSTRTYKLKELTKMLK